MVDVFAPSTHPGGAAVSLSAGVGPGHRPGQDDVLHAPAPVRRDRGVPRAVGDLLGLHGLHGRRESAAIWICNTGNLVVCCSLL